jgi:hypothetical protein
MVLKLRKLHLEPMNIRPYIHWLRDIHSSVNRWIYSRPRQITKIHTSATRRTVTPAHRKKKITLCATATLCAHVGCRLPGHHLSYVVVAARPCHRRMSTACRVDPTLASTHWPLPPPDPYHRRTSTARRVSPAPAAATASPPCTGVHTSPSTQAVRWRHPMCPRATSCLRQPPPTALTGVKVNFLFYFEFD